MNGDLVAHFDAGRMIDYHNTARDLVIVGYSSHIHGARFGVVELKEDRVVGWQEKPTVDFPICAGIYVIDPSVLARVRPRGATSVTWVVESCLSSGEPTWIDVGRREELGKVRGAS